MSNVYDNNKKWPPGKVLQAATVLQGMWTVGTHKDELWWKECSRHVLRELLVLEMCTAEWETWVFIVTIYY